MLTVVTAADQPYWRCLYQFLLSAERHHIARDHRVIAYDLGLEDDPREELHRRFPWCAFRRFDFTACPPHVAMARRNYAWKAIIVARIVEESAHAVLWLDSATLFEGSLTILQNRIAAHGVFTLGGQTPLAKRCHPATLAAMRAPLEIRDQPERAAGVVGIDPTHPIARAIVADWRRWSLMPEVIEPSSACEDSIKHRWEQSILSILLLSAVDRNDLTLSGEEIDIGSPTPVRWLSTRNKVRQDVPLWLDPIVRLYFHLWKACDRHLIALNRWHRNRIWGAHRWIKEHFTVHLLHRPSGRSAPIKPDDWCYYADPFLWRHKGKLWLFVEQFLYRKNSGRLVCMPVADDLTVGPPTPVLDIGHHASFPYLFEHDGHLFMVPETCAGLTVDLFVCDRFPDRWRRVRRLFYGLDAADSVIFRHDELWWLLTSVRERPDSSSRHLEIYFTDDLLAGDWRPHPVNARRLYTDQPCGSFRNAGPPLMEGDRLLRPVQRSHHHYGEGAALMRIERLSPEAFTENPTNEEHDLSRLLARVSPHHLSLAGDIAAFDVRDRAH